MEIKSHFQNEHQQTMALNFDEDEELYKKCYSKMEDWQKLEDEEFLKNSLKKLGLCEKKGLDGQVMLYPTMKKERKLEKQELDGMVSRLYKVKQIHDSDKIHLNDKALKSLQEQAQKSKLIHSQLQKNQKKNDQQETHLFSNSNFNSQNSSFL